jgi:RNA polymerase sigma factor (sigma-70 family)
MEEGKLKTNRDYFIRVNGQRIPVSKEVYLAYYQSKRRERYFSHDIKTETPIRDKSGVVTGYRPGREDSLERLMAAYGDFVDAAVDVAEEAIRAVMMERLYDALTMLPDVKRELIDALFFSNDGEGMTEREYAEIWGISQQTVHSRKASILALLKKLLEN